jgi:hypothetical protein
MGVSNRISPFQPPTKKYYVYTLAYPDGEVFYVVREQEYFFCGIWGTRQNGKPECRVTCLVCCTSIHASITHVLTLMHSLGGRLTPG